MSDLTVYVCKMCGRAIRWPQKPNYCYFDRMTAIENVSDEDAKTMGLFSGHPKGKKLERIEFWKDYLYHPDTGDSMLGAAKAEEKADALQSTGKRRKKDFEQSLEEFQDNIMTKVMGK